MTTCEECDQLAEVRVDEAELCRGCAGREKGARARRLRRLLGDLKEAVRAVVAAADPVNDPHDAAADLALLHLHVARVGREAEGTLADALLLWLARNRRAVRRVVAGDMTFWGDRGERTSVDDMPRAMVGLFDALEARRERAPRTYGEPLIASLNGDETALEVFRDHLDDLARSCISKNGLRVGSARDVLGGAFDEFFTTTRADRLEQGRPAARLGTGNARFQAHHRRGCP